MIYLEKVCKDYGDFRAVDIEILNIPKGNFFGFIGSNGAGKTTTIKMITGLMRPTTGKILIGGFDILKQPEKAKKLFGFVADNPMVYNKLTGREFIRFMANIYGYRSDSNLENRINELLSKFDLKNSADNLIQSYSRGMKQKISIAGTLIHNPEVLILDEPIVGLDPQGVKLLKDILVGLVQEGKTIIMSTHVLEIAEKLCDTIGIIKNGKMVFNGSVKEIQEAKGNKSLEDIFMELVGHTQTEEQDEY